MSAASTKQARACSISGGPCPHAERCVFAEGNGNTCTGGIGNSGPSNRKNRLEMCAVASAREFNDCRPCPDRRRCKDVWRCWRREKLDAGSPLVEELRAIDERVAVKEQYRVDKTGWRPK